MQKGMVVVAICDRCNLGTVEPRTYTIIGAEEGTRIVTLCRLCREFISRGMLVKWK